MMYYDTNGCRLTDCCKAYSTYDADSEMLLCDTCGHIVVGGEGDGSEHDPNHNPPSTEQIATGIPDLDGEWAEFAPQHMLNQGDYLMRRYRRIEDVIWAREQGPNCPSIGERLDEIHPDLLDAYFKVVQLDMARRALEHGALQCSCCATSIDIFKAYRLATGQQSTLTSTEQS